MVDSVIAESVQFLNVLTESVASVVSTEILLNRGASPVQVSTALVHFFGTTVRVQENSKGD